MLHDLQLTNMQPTQQSVTAKTGSDKLFGHGQCFYGQYCYIRLMRGNRGSGRSPCFVMLCDV